MNVSGKAQINVTPLIDVLLVLIIIFMVITPIAPRGLPAIVPPQADAPHPSDTVSREIVISISKDGSLDINQQLITLAALGERLADLYRRHINNHLFIRGDRSLDYQAVAKVIDIARGAGWDQIGLMTR